MAVEIIVPTELSTVASLLNGHDVKLHPNICVYTHILMLFSTFIGEAFLCTG